MHFDGLWNITVDTPMGEQKSALALSSDAGTITGTQTSGSEENLPIYDIATDGDSISWKTDITSPFAMTLKFAGQVDGDTIAGKVKAGPFPRAPFTGNRAA